MKITRLLVACFVAVLLAIGVLLATRAPNDIPQMKRLPDGSYLKIVSIGVGTNHIFALPPNPRWKGFLLAHLPGSWTARLGWWAGSASVGVAHQPGEEALAIFTVCEMARGTSFSSSPELTLCDEIGVVLDSAGEGPTAATFDGKRDWKLVGWKLSHVPRDSKRLRLRFSEMGVDGKTRQQLVEFLVANPLARKAAR